jgi:DNA repair ATPase RecN
MQSLSDDERRQVLGEVLSDQLQAILEYVQEIPFIKQEIHEVKERLTSVEQIVKGHEVDIRQIRQHLAI